MELANKGSPAAPAQFVSFKMDDAAHAKKIEPSKKAVAGRIDRKSTCDIFCKWPTYLYIDS
jgi:hypothetical protein